MRLSVFDSGTQRDALEQLVELARNGSIHPLVRRAALQITRDCNDRDDMCELEALLNAIKYGTPNVEALRDGLKYVADPRWADFFTAPNRLLKECEAGACAGDCDDHAALLAAMAASLGFCAGLEVWGPDTTQFVHVYAIVGFPKRNPDSVMGLDSTVPDSTVGWRPPGGSRLMAWFENYEEFTQPVSGYLGGKKRGRR